MENGEILNCHLHYGNVSTIFRLSAHWWRENRQNNFNYKIQTTKLKNILLSSGAKPVKIFMKNKHGYSYMTAKVKQVQGKQKKPKYSENLYEY